MVVDKGHYAIVSMKKEMKRRFLSQRTVDSYLWCVEKFLKRVDKDPRRITKKEIKDYLDEMVEEKKAGSTLNLHYSSIKFLIEEVLHRRMFLNMK